MANRTGKRRPKRDDERSGPSIQFVIMLIIGLAFLAWAFFALMVKQPGAQP
jgi:hypothetical protein